MQPKKQLKVQYIGIFEEKDSIYWPKMHFLKEGQKIRAWVDPPPLIRAMPERKRSFSIDVFPNSVCLWQINCLIDLMTIFVVWRFGSLVKQNRGDFPISKSENETTHVLREWKPNRQVLALGGGGGGGENGGERGTASRCRAISGTLAPRVHKAISAQFAFFLCSRSIRYYPV